MLVALSARAIPEERLRRIPVLISVFTGVLSSGCWKTELISLPQDRIPLSPLAGGPADWVVETFELDIQCPNGELSQFYLVYPESADLRDDPLAESMPLAVVYHSGAFDYVFAPSPEDPLAGATHQSNTRLNDAWAVRRVFITMGMYPTEDEAVEFHTGALVGALATNDIAMLFPSNCWGDAWHNRSALAENDYTADLFFRNGRTAAEFAWRHATEAFPPARPLELPISVDDSRVYAVGLGDGGRGVSELLSAMNDDPTFQVLPNAVVVDSLPDDLRAYYDAPALYNETIIGLNRIFPDGRDSTTKGSLGFLPNAAFPSRVGYLYSTGDTTIPAASHAAALAKMPGAVSDLWVYQAITQSHVLSAGSSELAWQISQFLVGGSASVDPAYISP